MIYAHSVTDRPLAEWETLEAHALRVAEAAQARAEAFGGGDVARMLGLLHDLGKAKPAFQRKLEGQRIEVAHSAEGARVLAGMGGFGRALAGIVAGHHGRLPDPDRLKARLATAEDMPLPDWCAIPTPVPPARLGEDSELALYRLQFLVRMLYGVLCDADDRETAAFYAEAEGRTVPERPTILTPPMRASFDAHMDGLGGGGAVNDLRRRVLAHARGVAAEAPGLFTLTVPTGGGKTLTSLGFGLDHALAHGLRRLIFVVPYTSIIEQTADVFRRVLGEDAVLEHHSNADWDGEDETEAEQRRVMGASWDVPVVVTTAVQFFESLHAARKKRCRKLPSLARAVIVLDEAQTMPLPLLRPCLAALRELMEGYGASVVLSTATQPALTKDGGFPGCEALEGAREIAPDPTRLFAALKRVEVRDAGPLDDAALADQIRKADRILTIVDNRRQARALFDAVRGAEGAAHLSTLMVPAHRRAVLANVRARLKDGAPVRLVSTSLIEAGVDVDFPVVLRAAAGIDSVAQAAGRCNREGRLDGPGLVEVFRSEHPAPPAVEQFAAIGRDVLAEGHDDPIGEAAVASYFRRLWDAYGKDALDAAEVGPMRIRGILNAIRKAGPCCPFEQIEAAFRIIPGGERSVIVWDRMWGVTWGASSDTQKTLRFGSAGAVARLVAPHSVNVPWGLWKALRDSGQVAWWMPERFEEQFAVLRTSDLYNADAGLGESGDVGGVF
ncbi:CRISPR-associated helicase Cas3 domain-containing protein [Oceaniovalibus guishaninsula JLT2003]|uniref:CRISPR-associated helicase Cas3 domain-containing protein n=1 Tax=Oceaniovalibus guishaninsula JLT2003 TaxID=1231392 RepID=K2H9M6_9RHOB|nr:CRISPR-associated endonuclease Cas3'' [Oceaniovalibus guishaninsula]EKE43332.1 CRISPR-associated helicase Cas3 domain-containing protein [Oceaniovalibus guishaninsula JLT2003]